MKVLFYAINGVGLGHLSRLLAIARALAPLARSLGARPDLQFITTSDASELAHDFPVFKIPSWTTIAKSGAPRRRYAASAKLLVSNVVAGLRPDLLVLDTKPEGAFQELLFLRDYARALVYIDRHKRPDAARSALHQRHVALYDRVLVPDEPGADDERPPTSPGVAARRRFIGRVCGYRPARAMSRDEARRYLGVAPARRLLYLSAGGGGDPAAERQLDALVAVLREDPRNHLVIGYGPLYQGPKRYGADITPLAEPAGAWRLFAGFDLAISAAGYNTYEELLAARVPSLFFAQGKGLDQQARRIARGHAAGLHGWLRDLEPATIRCEVASLLDDAPRRAAVLEALERRARPDGALRAAVSLLELYASTPGASVDRRRLFLAACAARAEAPTKTSRRPTRARSSGSRRPAARARPRGAARPRARVLGRARAARPLRALARGPAALGSRALSQWERALGLTRGERRRLLARLARDVCGDARADARARLLTDAIETLRDALGDAAAGARLRSLLDPDADPAALPGQLRALSEELEARALGSTNEPDRIDMFDHGAAEEREAEDFTLRVSAIADARPSPAEVTDRAHEA
ncbi:MAG: hypothetical protein H6713_20790 [Myxococcales bacterium]|nr:hypothetical protein [Myxococcales bacterium]